MKSIFLALMIFLSTISYSLDIYRVDKLNFGDVVRGDKEVALKNFKVYVKGIPNEYVRLYLDDEVNTEAGRILFRPKSRVIKLNNNGRGYFVLNCKLKPNYSKYGDIDDHVSFNVKYE